MESIIIQNIFQNLPVGLLVINPQGEIILANASASMILGYPCNAILGRGWADIFLEAAENELFNQVIVDVIWEEELNLHRTVPYARPNDEVLQLSITTSFIRSPDGLVGIVVLLHDVTEIYALHLQEKAILEEKNRLERERTESLNKLAMAVAHQVRNPTTAIGGFATLMLKKSAADANSGKYLQNILSCTRRLEDVVQSVYDYAFLSCVSVRRIPVHHIVERLREGVRQKMLELSKIATLTVHSPDFDVEIDARLFVQALKEISDNAVESLTSAQGAIEANISHDENSVFITIQDNGAGIPDEDMPYVFDPFFTTKAVGVGMGLCRARRIIEEHHGRVSIESVSGIGTKVHIRIPRSASFPLAMKGEQVMEIVDQLMGNVMVLKLKGRLNSATATNLKDKVKSCVRDGHIFLVVDMGDVDFVDSSGLGSLVASLRSVNKLGGNIRIAVLQPRVRAVFELIRLHHIFEIFDSVDTAASDFPKAGKDAHE
jgi:anti-anti-sigma factor